MKTRRTVLRSLALLAPFVLLSGCHVHGHRGLGVFAPPGQVKNAVDPPPGQNKNKNKNKDYD